MSQTTPFDDGLIAPLSTQLTITTKETNRNG